MSLERVLGCKDLTGEALLWGIAAAHGLAGSPQDWQAGLHIAP